MRRSAVAFYVHSSMSGGLVSEPVDRQFVLQIVNFADGLLNSLVVPPAR